MLILGVGSNLGDRKSYLQSAVAALKSLKSLSVSRVSPVYESDALLPPGAPDGWDSPYLNLALSCDTALSPDELLLQLKSIEARIGRQVGGRWGPRVIDIDILAWGNRVIQTERLHIPHKGLVDRPFALWPLADLLPEWVYPLEDIHLGKTAKKLVFPWGSRFDGRAPFATRQVTASVEPIQLVAAINMTPDSFSDGGNYNTVEKAVTQINRCLSEGASVIDIGAESTRPGAILITPEEEWARLLPLLSAIKTDCNIPVLSIDTRHIQTAEKAYHFGMRVLNDISGFKDPALCEFAAHHQLDVVLMHHIGIPADPASVIALSENPVSVVFSWGEARIKALEAVGISRERIIFDIGIGFGKTPKQSFELLRNISVFHHLGVRLYVGHSRKSFFNCVTDVPFVERDLETSILSAYLAKQGVHYLRVHNIALNRRAISVGEMLQ